MKTQYKDISFLERLKFSVFSEERVISSRKPFKDPANHCSVPKSGGLLPAGILGNNSHLY